MAKENDWIIATMNNPGLDVGEFQTLANMSLDNTQLLSKDYYLNITEVMRMENFLKKNLMIFIELRLLDFKNLVQWKILSNTDSGILEENIIVE